MISRPSEGGAPAHAALRHAALVRHPGIARVLEAGYDDEGARVVEEVEEARPLADGRCRLPRGDALAEGLLEVLRGLAHLHRQAMVHGALSRQTVFSDGRDLFLTGVALSADNEGTASADVRAWAEMTAELLEGSRDGELTEIVQEAARQVLAAGPVGHSLDAPRVVRAINRALLSDDEMASEDVQDQEGVEDEIETSRVMRALLAIVHVAGKTIVGLFTTVLTLALIGAVVAGGVLWFLDQLPAEVPVPNVEGMEREEARARLEAEGLGVGRVRSVYREDVEPNHVAETTPPPGMMVREGREVTLVVSMGAARVDVPRLTGLKPAEAEDVLEAKGLRLVEDGKMRSDMPEGEIVAQNPPPTRKIAQGERVVVQTSGGSSFGVIEVPAEDEDAEARRMVFRRIEVIVPRGDALQRVRVREGYGDDLETSYDRLHRPGDRIKLDTYGRPGKHIQVSIEGEQVFKTQL